MSSLQQSITFVRMDQPEIDPCNDDAITNGGDGTFTTNVLGGFNDLSVIYEVDIEVDESIIANANDNGTPGNATFEINNTSNDGLNATYPIDGEDGNDENNENNVTYLAGGDIGGGEPNENDQILTTEQDENIVTAADRTINVDEANQINETTPEGTRRQWSSSRNCKSPLKIRSARRTPKRRNRSLQPITEGEAVLPRSRWNTSFNITADEIESEDTNDCRLPGWAQPKIPNNNVEPSGTVLFKKPEPLPLPNWATPKRTTRQKPCSINFNEIEEQPEDAQPQPDTVQIQNPAQHYLPAWATPKRNTQGQSGQGQSGIQQAIVAEATAGDEEVRLIPEQTVTRPDTSRGAIPKQPKQPKQTRQPKKGRVLRYLQKNTETEGQSQIEGASPQRGNQQLPCADGMQPSTSTAQTQRPEQYYLPAWATPKNRKKNTGSEGQSQIVEASPKRGTQQPPCADGRQPSPKQPKKCRVLRYSSKNTGAEGQSQIVEASPERGTQQPPCADGRQPSPKQPKKCRVLRYSSKNTGTEGQSQIVGASPQRGNQQLPCADGMQPSTSTAQTQIPEQYYLPAWATPKNRKKNTGSEGQSQIVEASPKRGTQQPPCADGRQPSPKQPKKCRVLRYSPKNTGTEEQSQIVEASPKRGTQQLPCADGRQPSPKQPKKCRVLRYSPKNTGTEEQSQTVVASPKRGTQELPCADGMQPSTSTTQTQRPEQYYLPAWATPKNRPKNTGTEGHSQLVGAPPRHGPQQLPCADGRQPSTSRGAIPKKPLSSRELIFSPQNNATGGRSQIVGATNAPRLGINASKEVENEECEGLITLHRGESLLLRFWQRRIKELYGDETNDDNISPNLRKKLQLLPNQKYGLPNLKLNKWVPKLTTFKEQKRIVPRMTARFEAMKNAAIAARQKPSEFKYAPKKKVCPDGVEKTVAQDAIPKKTSAAVVPQNATQKTAAGEKQKFVSQGAIPKRSALTKNISPTLGENQVALGAKKDSPRKQTAGPSGISKKVCADVTKKKSPTLGENKVALGAKKDSPRKQTAGPSGISKKVCADVTKTKSPTLGENQVALVAKKDSPRKQTTGSSGIPKKVCADVSKKQSTLGENQVALGARKDSPRTQTSGPSGIPKKVCADVTKKKSTLSENQVAPGAKKDSPRKQTAGSSGIPKKVCAPVSNQDAIPKQRSMGVVSKARSQIPQVSKKTSPTRNQERLIRSPTDQPDGNLVLTRGDSLIRRYYLTHYNKPNRN